MITVAMSQHWCHEKTVTVADQQSRGQVPLNNPSSTSLIVLEASRSQDSKEAAQISDAVADLKSGSNILPTHNGLLPN